MKNDRYERAIDVMTELSMEVLKVSNNLLLGENVYSDETWQRMRDYIDTIEKEYKKANRRDATEILCDIERHVGEKYDWYNVICDYDSEYVIQDDINLAFQDSVHFLDACATSEVNPLDFLSEPYFIVLSDLGHNVYINIVEDEDHVCELFWNDTSLESMIPYLRGRFDGYDTTLTRLFEEYEECVKYEEV